MFWRSQDPVEAPQLHLANMVLQSSLIRENATGFLGLMTLILLKITGELF